MRVETPAPGNRFLIGTGPSNHIFAKEQIGSTVFFFPYIGLVTGNSGTIYLATKPPMKFSEYTYFEYLGRTDNRLP